MVGAAGLVVFLGYAVLAYGWQQVRGCNAGLIDMIAFWRPPPQCNKDGGANVAATPTTKPLGTQPYVAPTKGAGSGPGAGSQPISLVTPSGQPVRIQS